MLSACRDSRCDCDRLVSLKTSPMDDYLAMKLKYIWTRCRLQIANPLDKLVRGGWTTLLLRAATFSCWGSLWGGVFQHVAHLVLPGDGLEQACMCVQSWAKEPAAQSRL